MGTISPVLVQWGKYFMLTGTDTIAPAGETDEQMYHYPLGPCLLKGASIWYRSGAGGPSTGAFSIAIPTRGTVYYLGLGDISALASITTGLCESGLDMYVDLTDAPRFITAINGTLAGNSLVYMSVWGEVLTPPMEPNLRENPIPISVEGYKWPLQRRA